MLTFLNAFSKKTDQLHFYCDQHLLADNVLFQVHKVVGKGF